MPSPNQHPPISEYVTLEITIRRDATEQSLALAGLANAYGWQTRQRVTLPTDLQHETPEVWAVTEGDLLQVSSELWGVELYGKNAKKGILDVEAQGTQDYMMWLYYDPNFAPAPKPTNMQELEAAARRQWDEHHYPFSMNFEPKDYMLGAAISPGDVTRERLADFIRHDKLDKHTLHGAIGKSLDVLGVAAGLVDAHRVGAASVDLEFLPYAELSRRLRASDLSTTQVSRLYDRLKYDIRNQIWSGKPAETGEIIVEGRFRGWSQGRPVRYESVALSSLAAVADSYEDAQTADYLRRLVRG